MGSLFSVCTCTCTMYLKYAPYDWLKYRGMAILVCRRKKIADGTHRCKSQGMVDIIPRTGHAVNGRHLYYIRVILIDFALQ